MVMSLYKRVASQVSGQLSTQKPRKLEIPRNTQICLESEPSFYSFLENENFIKTTTVCIIFWNFTKFQYRFHSPEVKLYLTSSNKKFVKQLSHKLPNDLRLWISGNYEILEKSPVSPPKMTSQHQHSKILQKQTLNFLVLCNFTFFVNFFQIYFSHECYKNLLKT